MRVPVSYTHLRAHETLSYLVCRLLLEKKIFLMIRRPPRSTRIGSSAASDVYKRQAVSFFTAHFLFRWRTAMVEWYHTVYDQARSIEGAAQRVQEDTIKFSRIMEGLGTSSVSYTHLTLPTNQCV